MEDYGKGILGYRNLMEKECIPFQANKAVIDLRPLIEILYECACVTNV